jgi:hypothetical protein
MVIGQIVDGYETALALSIEALADPFGKRGRPASPARIESARVECMGTPPTADQQLATSTERPRAFELATLQDQHRRMK